MTMIATGTALVSIAIDLGTELGNILVKRATDPGFNLLAHLKARFLYLLGKLLDIPVSTYTSHSISGIRLLYRSNTVDKRPLSFPERPACVHLAL